MNNSSLSLHRTIAQIIFMSPRIKTLRKILNPPVIKGFKPYGNQSVSVAPEPVVILFEEYEALRLCDFDHYNHHESSVMMGVSRPTFTRIYASALRKIATAFVEGRQISIEGGKVYFDSDWYHCRKCGSFFNNPEREKEISRCPLCGDRHIATYDISLEDETPMRSAAKCICQECGYEQDFVAGQPCSRLICPQCKGKMYRKRRSTNI